VGGCRHHKRQPEQQHDHSQSRHADAAGASPAAHSNASAAGDRSGVVCWYAGVRVGARHLEVVVLSWC
jgi:hypothetical protein